MLQTTIATLPINTPAWRDDERLTAAIVADIVMLARADEPMNWSSIEATTTRLRVAVTAMGSRVLLTLVSGCIAVHLPTLPELADVMDHVERLCADGRDVVAAFLATEDPIELLTRTVRTVLQQLHEDEHLSALARRASAEYLHLLIAQSKSPSTA